MIEEIIPEITTRHPINFPFTNTFIQIELEAHNELGYSNPSVLVIRGVTGTSEEATLHTTLGLSVNKYIIQIIIGSLVLVLLLLILLIDISVIFTRDSTYSLSTNV